MSRIEKGEGTLGMLINDDKLYKDLEKSASELNLLLEDIRLNPKRYVRVSVF
jgi:phospholipid/cholesterol/gamma-HCH transport system substrate-binding protein